MKNIIRKIGGFFRRAAASGSLFVCLLIVAVLLFNFFFYTLNGAVGLTAALPTNDEDFSLSGVTDALFADAQNNLALRGEKVTITFCMYRDRVASSQTGKYVLFTAEQLAERYPAMIELKFVNLVTMLDADGNVFDVENELLKDEKLTMSSVIFTCGRNCRVLSSSGYADFYTFDTSTGDAYVSAYNGEEIFSSEILSVASLEKPKTARFTTMHGESLDQSFASMVAAAGYTVDVIDLRDTGADELLKSTDLVVIASPSADFERGAEGIRSECEKLEDYLTAGGNLYVTADPYAAKLTNLEKLLADCGISYVYTDTGLRTIVRDSENAITTDGFTLVAAYPETAESIRADAEKYAHGGVILRDAAAITTGKNARPILISSSAAVTQADGKTVNGDGSYPLAALGSLDGSGNVFFVGSAFLNVSDALVTVGYSNKDFFYAVAGNAFGAQILPYGCKLVTYNTETLENLTMGTARRDMALLMAIPAVLAVVCAVVFIRRKNR